ncbi:MAG TPA: DUF2934 domain-containing protein [bacterium]|nr:DUF2934 domain-containing protein [bacterium]
MNTNPLKTGVLTEHSVGVGTVSRKMVRERAVELALIDGRAPNETSKADWVQARRELTGEPDPDLNAAAVAAAPESERWNPVPVGEDEDGEGRSDKEQLVAEGMAGAEQDQKLQAARTAKKVL